MSNKSKILVIICDGLPDRPVAQLQFRTPLQAAKKPNFDVVARNGICGQLDPIAPGIRPGSDTAHLALLGYNPYEIYTGRGPFEAAGLGLEVEPGDIAFRCNFATVDQNLVVRDRRAGRIHNGTEQLADELTTEFCGVKFIVKPGVEHRAVLLMRGPNLSSQVTDADPHREGEKMLKVKPLTKEAEFTTKVLNDFLTRSHKILAAHEVNIARKRKGLPPANILLPRGAGIVPKIPKFRLRGACIAGIPLIKGVCRLAGLDIIDVKGATGSTDTDYMSKARATIETLRTYDFVLLNIKAPDVFGHDGDYRGKMAAVRKLDTMLKLILVEIHDETIIALTSDHSTPVSVRDHSGDPVPIAIKGIGVRKDDVKKFDELSVVHGALGRLQGMTLMSVLMDLADRSEKFGS